MKLVFPAPDIIGLRSGGIMGIKCVNKHSSIFGSILLIMYSLLQVSLIFSIIFGYIISRKA